jgi:hypothetical protein
MALNAAVQPAAAGRLGVVVHRRGGATKREAEERALDARLARLKRELVRDDSGGHFFPKRAGLLYQHRRWDTPSWQQAVLAWLRDNVHPGLPRAYYRALLGHDLHVSTFAQLYVEHFHASEPDPFTGRIGWTENVGQVSCGKVTTAFRDFECAQLVTESALYGDYKFHEVGTSATAEANTDTALVVTTGIARATGNQTNPTASTYQSVATVTADTSETWQEHGLFNASTSVTLMDRSLISPTVAVVSLDTVTFTYVLTKTAEA